MMHPSKVISPYVTSGYSASKAEARSSNLVRKRGANQHMAGDSPDTNMNDIIHCSMDPENFPFRLVNCSYSPTVIVSKSKTDNIDISSYFTTVNDAPLWLAQPIGPEVPTQILFSPVPMSQYITDTNSTTSYTYHKSGGTDWFNTKKPPSSVANLADSVTAELPVPHSVKRIGESLGDNMSSLALRGGVVRLSMKGHSATNLIIKGDTREIRIEDPFDIDQYTNMDLDTLTSSPKYRRPPLPLYGRHINSSFGPELVEEQFHVPPGHVGFNDVWYEDSIDMAKGDLFTYTKSGNTWQQRQFLLIAGLHYSPNMWGSGLHLTAQVGTPADAAADSGESVKGYRVYVGFTEYDNTQTSKVKTHWYGHNSASTDFNIPLVSAYGQRVPDVISFECEPSEPTNATDIADFDPRHVRMRFRLTNTHPLPKGYLRPPLSLIILSDFEEGAALQRTISVAAEGTSVSSQRLLAPGQHPPVSSIPTQALLQLAHIAYHDPDSSLDYFMSDEELAALGMDGGTYSNVSLLGRYGAVDWKKLGSNIWNFVKKEALPVAGTLFRTFGAASHGAAGYEYNPLKRRRLAAAAYDYV